jgi:hypothetical protein
VEEFVSQSQTEYIRRSRTDQEPIVQVTFDTDDGAIERVCLYCEISDSWLPVKGPLPAILELKIITFISDWFEIHAEAM